jgi:hypothetical protein
LLGNVPGLRRLWLSSHHTEDSILTWAIIPKTPAIPILEELWIDGFMMRFQHLSDFVLKHKKTLKGLELVDVNIPDGNTAALGGFYRELSTPQELEHIHQQKCCFREDPDVHFPDMPVHLLEPFSTEEEDDDGFIWVETEQSSLTCEGKDIVNSVLNECAAYMCPQT